MKILRRANDKLARSVKDFAPRDQYLDQQGEIWNRTPSGRYTCESAGESYLEDWPLDQVERLFGPLTDVPKPARQVTVTVAVDPVWHGHNLTAADAQDIVRSAINDRPGLEVVEVTR